MLFHQRGPRGPRRAEAVSPARRGLLALGCARCLGALPISPAAAQSPEVGHRLAQDASGLLAAMPPRVSPPRRPR